eukprot:scaffold2767_cov177-Amphora_coffeaeformis.AAC.6
MQESTALASCSTLGAVIVIRHPKEAVDADDHDDKFGELNESVLVLRNKTSEEESISSLPGSNTCRMSARKNAAKEHEAFRNSLLDDVLGHNAGDKVPMEKVVMLLWSFRDDASVVKFMAQFVSKVGDVRARSMLIGIPLCMSG